MTRATKRRIAEFFDSRIEERERAAYNWLHPPDGDGRHVAPASARECQAKAEKLIILRDELLEFLSR